MQLSDSFWEMTERFVNYIHTETGFNIIVCDEKGIIKKAYVKERIGQSHAGAQKILSTSINEIAITEEDERRNPLTKEGLNYAIVIDGEKLATFGVAGKLSVVTPIMKLASMILVGWVNQLRQQDLLQATAKSVFGDIRALTGKIEGAANKFESVSHSMALVANEAASSVTATDKILDSFQQIAMQSYILSVNASIEAMHLGEQGKPFLIVAEEMGRLSKDAKGLMVAAQNTTNELRSKVANVEATSQQSRMLFSENLDTMRGVTPMINTLMDSIKTLEDSFKDN
jgi:hypothetical protein